MFLEGRPPRRRMQCLAVLLGLFEIPASGAALISVHGRISDYATGAPVANAFVEFTIDDVAWTYTYSADDGTYEWTDYVDFAPGASGEIDVSAFGYASASAAFDPAQPDVQADFALHEGASVSGIVLDAAAVPVHDVLVNALGDDGAAGWIVVEQVLTGADGRYEMPGLPPGTYRVCTGGLASASVQQCFDGIDISRVGDIDTATPVDMAEDEHRSGVDFSLHAGGSISGTITDVRTGSVIANAAAEIELYDVDGNALDSTWVGADTNGVYRLAGIPAGTFYVSAASRLRGFHGTQLYSGIDCPSGECPPATSGQSIQTLDGVDIGNIDFVFSSDAVVHGTVVDAESQLPLGDIEVAACFDGGFGGIVCWYQTTTRAVDGGYDLYVDSQQDYMFIAIADDDYIDQMYPLIDNPEGSDYFSDHAIHISPGDSVDHIDFALKHSAWISGTVFDGATGQPLPDAYVIGYAESGRGGWIADVDANGHYASLKAIPGTYYVAAHEGWPQRCAFYFDRPCPPDEATPISSVQPTPIVVAGDEQRTGVDIVLPAEVLFADGFDTPAP